MRILCSDYAGFKAVVTELGAPSEVFYRGDASTTQTLYVFAYYNSGNAYVVFSSVGGVAVATVVADYPSAVLIAGLQNVEF